MPLSDFAGTRNWGYDGVMPFAPDAAYGSPDDLKRLIDEAHERGLMMFLDVVYNHFGPLGNHLHRYADSFFEPEEHTPWGAAITSRSVRCAISRFTTCCTGSRSFASTACASMPSTGSSTAARSTS